MLKLLLILVAFSSGVLCQGTSSFPTISPYDCYPGSTTCITTAPKPRTAACVNSSMAQSGYVITGNLGAHKLYTGKVTWDEARKSCMDEGAQLAIINSKEEARMLVTWMEQHNVQFAWVGAHDHFKEGEWVTLTGETLHSAGYDTWTTMWPYQPDDPDGSQNCGALVDDVGLADLRCTMQWPYFCKINPC